MQIYFNEFRLVSNSEMYAPEFDEATFPPHVILKSTNNTPIEGFWRLLHQKTGDNLKEIILEGKRQAIFNSTIPEHS